VEGELIYAPVQLPKNNHPFARHTETPNATMLKKNKK
ncbi:MAG: hypothetical protein ACI9JK_000484, partial [Phycisphaerales bacterium]